MPLNIALDLRAVTPQATGIGQFAHHVAEALALHPAGHRYHVIIAPGRDVSDHGFPRITQDRPSPGWDELHLPTALEYAGIDCYVSPLFTCPMAHGFRSLVTIHDPLPVTHPDLCTSEFMQFWHARLAPSLRACSLVMTTSAWSKELLTGRLGVPAERVVVVRQSVDQRLFPRDAATVAAVLGSHGLSHQGYVLGVGAIDPRKNLIRLLEAFARMPDDGLVLALAGPVVTKLRMEPFIAGSGLQGRVKLLGFVPPDDLPAIYAGARCIAFPSLAEGFGRPCIEGMASGVPVVASSATALPETCGDAALLPDPEDVGALTEALTRACGDRDERERLIANGLRRAAGFTPECFAADLHAAFAVAMRVDGSVMRRTMGMSP